MTQLQLQQRVGSRLRAPKKLGALHVLNTPTIACYAAALFVTGLAVGLAF